MRSLLTLSLSAVVALLTTSPAGAQWTVSQLPQGPRSHPAVATVGNLAFFAGGEDAPLALNFDVVEIYDAGTDTWSQVTLSQARSRLAATAVGQLAIFAGGGLDPSNSSDRVDIFDTQTMTWRPRTILSEARSGAAATSVGQKALFAFGQPTSTTVSGRVDIYDAQTDTWTHTTLGVARGALAATTVGNLAMFAGGVDGSGTVSKRVDIYNETTGLWSTTDLSEARGSLGAATVGSRAYFFGGGDPLAPSVSDTIDIYDFPTDTWSVSTLPAARFGLQAAVLGNTLVLAGGGDQFGGVDTVFMLNTGTGQWDTSRALTQARQAMGVASVGGKAMFAGGSLPPPLFPPPPTDVIDIHEPVGLNYCVAAPNSTGCAATISAEGSASLAANDLVLSSVCVPDNVYIFFHGTGQQELPFGNGHLCLGGTIVRILPAGVGSGGLAQSAIDLPSAGITTPGVRNFQCWFRDPTAGGAMFDTSDALTITFVP